MTSGIPAGLGKELLPAASLAALHAPRRLHELAERLREMLADAGVPGEIALFQAGSSRTAWITETAAPGTGLPEAGSEIELRDQFLLRACRALGPLYRTFGEPAGPAVPVAALPLRYGATVVGHLVLFGGPGVPSDLRGTVEALADHVAVAFTNIKLLEDSVRIGDQHFGNLQAYKELDGLLAETNIDRIASRILAASLHTLSTDHGAILLKDPDDVLTFRAGWLPDELLGELRDHSGAWWPETLLSSDLSVLRVDPVTGGFPGLQGAPARPGLQSLVGMPLRNERGTVGVVIAVNAPIETERFRRDIETFKGLCDLGAAVLENHALHDQALTNKRYEEQFRIAQSIQERLRPGRVPTGIEVESAFRMAAAEFVGADYLDLRLAEDRSLNAIIADVSGHGVGPALIMSSVRSEFRSLANLPEMTMTMSRLNAIVSEEVGESGMFVTAFFARVAPDGRRIDYVNAGHNHGILWRAASGVAERLEADSPPLGFMEDVEYIVRSIAVQEHDLLVIYSDGIVEAAAPSSDDFFGDERLEEVIGALAGETAAKIADGIFAAVHSFTTVASTTDDVSVIVLRILGATPAGRRT